MPNHWPDKSLLSPRYGSAAQSIRAAVGVSRDEQAARLARQLDGVRRAIVLRDRDWRGLIITGGEHLGGRVTPDHKKFTRIYSPDGTVIVEVGRDPHELALRVDTALVCAACPGLSPEDIDLIIERIAENTEFIAWLCDTCSGADPGPWPGGG